jgi:hypothetical protein
MEFLKTLEPVKCKDIVTSVLKSAGRHSPYTFPFGNPVSIERCHVPIVQSMEYWITEKTDGTRVCLLFGTSSAGVQTAVVMDRVGNLFGFPVACEAEMFHGSVFDAELVRVGGEHQILIFDVAMLEGEIIRDHLSVRLELIADVVSKTVCGVTNLTLHAKNMVPVGKAMDLSSTVASDGYILTPEAGAAPLPGTAWSVFKIKTYHTIDVLCINKELWYGSGEELLRLDALPGFDVHCASDLATIPDNAVVEFFMDVSKDNVVTLRAKDVRADKNVPNNALCVTRTIASIQDNITLADLITVLPAESTV